jgi:Ni,Fe-hydrogenase III component G
METNTLLESGKSLIEKWIDASNMPEDNRLDIWVSRKNFKPVIQEIVNNRWGYLITITGLDIAPVIDSENNETQPGQLEALYHFTNDSAIITVRVKVPYSDTKLESICDLIPSATIYEREIIELLGFELINTPNTDRLVLPDSWPEGIYPLRKSFTSLQVPEILAKEQTND